MSEVIRWTAKNGPTTAIGLVALSSHAKAPGKILETPTGLLRSRYAPDPACTKEDINSFIDNECRGRNDWYRRGKDLYAIIIDSAEKKEAISAIVEIGDFLKESYMKFPAFRPGLQFILAFAGPSRSGSGALSLVNGCLAPDELYATMAGAFPQIGDFDRLNVEVRLDSCYSGRFIAELMWLHSRARRQASSKWGLDDLMGGAGPSQEAYEIPGIGMGAFTFAQKLLLRNPPLGPEEQALKAMAEGRKKLREEQERLSRPPLCPPLVSRNGGKSLEFDWDSIYPPPPLNTWIGRDNFVDVADLTGGMQCAVNGGVRTHGLINYRFSSSISLSNGSFVKVPVNYELCDLLEGFELAVQTPSEISIPGNNDIRDL